MLPVVVVMVYVVAMSVVIVMRCATNERGRDVDDKVDGYEDHRVFIVDGLARLSLLDTGTFPK